MWSYHFQERFLQLLILFLSGSQFRSTINPFGKLLRIFYTTPRPQCTSSLLDHLNLATAMQLLPLKLDILCFKLFPTLHETQLLGTLSLQTTKLRQGA